MDHVLPKLLDLEESKTEGGKSSKKVQGFHRRKKLPGKASIHPPLTTALSIEFYGNTLTLNAPKQ